METIQSSNRLGGEYDLASKHPNILEKIITAYDNYAQEVGVVIPRGEKFEQTAKNNFPPVTQEDVQTIELGNMFALGYPLNTNATNPQAIIN